MFFIWPMGWGSIRRWRSLKAYSERWMYFVFDLVCSSVLKLIYQWYFIVPTYVRLFLNNWIANAKWCSQFYFLLRKITSNFKIENYLPRYDDDFGNKRERKWQFWEKLKVILLSLGALYKRASLKLIVRKD